MNENVPPQISYDEDGRVPRFVGGNWANISTAYGLPIKYARQWYEQGAPIILVGKKPVAEVWELWCWMKEEYG